ncbi:hypothetical protein BDF21DRAFT_482210 [Thamnidium elegans]|nr:hypothetical protein BDF21DRAFT_482210 [Thamnidium elegans]
MPKLRNRGFVYDTIKIVYTVADENYQRFVYVNTDGLLCKYGQFTCPKMHSAHNNNITIAESKRTYHIIFKCKVELWRRFAAIHASKDIVMSIYGSYNCFAFLIVT